MAFRRHVRAVVERHGGLLVKAEGETVMASFPSAAASLRAAAGIQAGLDAALKDAPLGAIARARVGISYGRVLREDRLDGFDFFGNTVNAAARLMRLAAPGEVLASSALLADPEAAALLSGAERRRVRLKGFDGEQTVLRPPEAPRNPIIGS
jgi:class 3 adenylate cyclase